MVDKVPKEYITNVVDYGSDVEIITNLRKYLVASEWGVYSSFKINGVAVTPDLLKNRVILDCRAAQNGFELRGKQGKLTGYDYNGSVFLLDNNDVLDVRVFKI